MENRTDQILNFLKEIEKYKTIKRRHFLSDGNKESDAEHSWHMAMFLVLLEKELPKDLDMKKMLKLALIHDLAEIYSGDPFAFDTEGKKDKKEKEGEAARKLFSQLPEDLNKELMDLFNEYEKRETKEAQTVNSIDKVQAILQNIICNGKTWQVEKVNYEMVDNYKRKDMLHNNFLLEIYEKLMKEAKDKKMF
ncbi:HD domain-containing protein [Candidatus Pacearchaeota archaeon]|nr:HD domain-containing protein [Candidatus Pacearchaeota archaeon]